MKVKVKDSEGFRPIDVILSFDNENDLKAFAQLMGKDQSVPSSIMNEYLISQKERDTMSKMMTCIWENLPKEAQELAIK